MNDKTGSSTRVATLDLAPELFLEFSKACKGKLPRRFVVKENALPDDAEIVRIGLANDGLLAANATTLSEVRRVR